MTGPQTEIEIRLWRDEFARMRQTPEWIDAAMDAADDLLRRYRARYGQSQPESPPEVWYDEPPFPKDGKSYPCWVDDERYACTVHWHREWLMVLVGDIHTHRLDGRRVSPITKPQEPTT